MRAVCWAATLVAAALLIPFALSNREPVSLGFWPLPFLIELPLYLLILLSLLAGYVIGGTAAWIARRHLRRELRHRRRHVEALERELLAVRSLPANQTLTERSGGQPEAPVDIQYSRARG